MLIEVLILLIVVGAAGSQKDFISESLMLILYMCISDEASKYMWANIFSVNINIQCSKYTENISITVL